MNRTTPSVKDYMTPVPHSITPEDSIVAARALMRRYSVRHLIVMKNGKLVGLVSDRDLLSASEFAGSRKRIPVEEVMTARPYTARFDAPLGQVARKMSQLKIGSAVIVEGSNVVGVLTTIDALRALADVLQGRIGNVARELMALRPKRGRTRPLVHPPRSRG
jgi:acetoin utilization protein AcuB